MKRFLLLSLISFVVSFCNGFIVENSAVTTSNKYSSPLLKMGLLDDISTILRPSKDSGISRNIFVRNQYPKVELPEDFILPDPKPLTITNTSDVPSLLQSSAALAIRLATSAFVLGWKIDTIFADPKDESKYSLQIGPFCISDSE